MNDKVEELRKHYDNTSLTAEIADAELSTEVVESPMVGITVRFPAETLQQIREAATAEGSKTTALIRRWVEERLSAKELRPAAAAMRVAATNLRAATAHIVIGGLNVEFHDEPAEAAARLLRPLASA
jgi:hypothetical protein